MTINKITKSPTPTELIKKVNELVEGVNTGGSRTSSIPIGHVYTIGYSELDAGQLPLLGGEYSRTTYADLWAWVQSKPSLLKTESEWQTLKAASGNKGVPYYSAGNGTTTFRVPMFGCYVKGSANIGDVGGFLAAGLPNIAGNSYNDFGFNIFGNGKNYQNGCIKVDAGGSSGFTSGASAGKLTIDASLSSPIYGNSDTVQPASIIQLYVVQAFGEVTNVGSTDVAAIAVGLQELETNKANVNLGNLSNSAYTIIQNAMMPDHTAIVNLTTDETERTYTAPANGWIIADLAGYNKNNAYLNISGIDICKGTSSGADFTVSQSAQILIKAGTLIKYKSGYVGTDSALRKVMFVPCLGGV